MLISVIVPVYNVPNQLLINCVNSILNQTYTKLELLIINDCSPLMENSVYLRALPVQDARIKYTELKENGGVSAARNIGLEQSSGEWVCFVDSDDYLPATALEQMLHVAEKCNVDIVNGHIHQNRRSSSTPPFVNSTECQVFSRPVSESDYVQALNIFELSIWGKIYKRKLWETIRFPAGISHFEDVIVLWQLVEKRPSYASSCNICYVKNYRQESVSHSIVTLQKHRKILKALKYALTMVPKLFHNLYRVQHLLSCFIVREAFANRGMYIHLTRDEASKVKIENKILLRELKKLGTLSHVLLSLLEVRVKLLGSLITGYPIILYYLIRLALRIELKSAKWIN